MQTLKKTVTILFGIVILALLTIFLACVFSGQIILHQSFNLGPLTIRYYGLILAAAVAAGFYLGIKRATQFGIEEKQAEDLLFWLVIFGFLGARLYHVASSFSYYRLHPADIVKVWNGGLSIYGAVIGGFITLIFCFNANRRHSDPERMHLSEGEESQPERDPSAGKDDPDSGLRMTPSWQIFNLLDWLTPSLLLGQIIGRFGNMFNYELFGYPTNLPWKMFVPFGFRPPLYTNYSFFHPLFLYEALGNAIILIILLKLAASGHFKMSRHVRKLQPGTLFFFYIILYNVLRFCLEFLRIDAVFVHGIRQNAVVSLLLVVAALMFLYWPHSHAKIP